MEHQIIADLDRRQFAGFHAAARLLGEHVAGFTQRPGDHRFAQRLPRSISPIGRQQRNMMIAAIHCRTHQIVKTGIHQHKVAAAHVFYRSHLGHQDARFRHQETPGFDLQLYRMPQMRGDAFTRPVPQTEIVFGIDRLFAVLIGNRQATAGGNGADVMTEIDHLLHHRIADPLQMLIIDAGTDMHVYADQF